jgi:hypothetical protein
MQKINEREQLWHSILDVDTVKPEGADGEEALSATEPEAHHQMLHEKKNKVNLSTWLRKNKDDRACKVSKLQKPDLFLLL